MINRILVLAAALVATGSGCAFWKDDNPCESIEEYQQAHVASEIRVPDGLSPPDRAGRLAIPAEPIPSEPLSANAGCLQKPPNYFDKPVATSRDN